MVNTRAHVLISGKVQGVCFRDYTQKMARRLGLAGWVRNLPDGRVEAVFEGEKEGVEEAVKWCREIGSPSSQVEDAVVEWGEFRGEFGGFGILYL